MTKKTSISRLDTVYLMVFDAETNVWLGMNFGRFIRKRLRAVMLAAHRGVV